MQRTTLGSAAIRRLFCLLLIAAGITLLAMPLGCESSSSSAPPVTTPDDTDGDGDGDGDPITATQIELDVQFVGVSGLGIRGDDVRRRAQQVEIQARFLTLNGDDLAGLGFDWTLGDASRGAFGANSTHDSAISTMSDVVGGGADDKSVVASTGTLNTFLPLAFDWNTYSSQYQDVRGYVSLPANDGDARFTAPESHYTKLETQNGFSRGVTLGTLNPFNAYALSGAFLSDSELQTVLRALNGEEGTVNLASPRLTLFNEQRAAIVARNEYGKASDLEEGFRGAASDVDPAATFLEVGIVLDVRPVITANNQVRLDLTVGSRAATVPHSQQLSSGGMNYQVEVPILQLGNAATEVTVRNGQTVLLGGLRQTMDGQTEAGVPLLSDVPFIGRLFRNDALIKDNQQLLIFITPRVVQAPE